MKAEIAKILQAEERAVLGTSIWKHKFVHWFAPRRGCMLCKKQRRADIRAALAKVVQKVVAEDSTMAIEELAGLLGGVSFEETLKARKIVIDGLRLQFEVLQYNEWHFLNQEFDEWMSRSCPIAEWPEK